VHLAQELARNNRARFPNESDAYRQARNALLASCAGPGSGALLVAADTAEEFEPNLADHPRVLTEALAAGGAEAKCAFEAMMQDIATIEAARRG
jgi:hypothetical protein